MTRRVEFRLSMPGRSSWDGRWSGQDRNYLLVRTVPNAVADELMAVGSWFHRWDDGWTAQVTARVMAPGERASKTAGFAGYDWMVTNIIAYGSPYTTGATPA